jgi:hypothetical protein
MRTTLRALGLVVALAAFGCDSSVDEGPVPFKKTDASQFDAMKTQMMEKLKTKAYTKVPSPSSGPAEKSK